MSETSDELDPPFEIIEPAHPGYRIVSWAGSVPDDTDQLNGPADAGCQET